MENKVEKIVGEDAEDETKLISGNGKEVFVNNETRQHLRAHQGVMEFLEEAISKINIPDNTTHLEKAINFGRIIGNSLLVETEPITPGEETDFALRVEREWPVRVTLESEGISCDSVTVKIKFDQKSKKYFLNTAYVGFPCPDSPYHISDKASEEYKEALEFWCSHALAYDPKIMGKPFKASWNSFLTRAQLLL